MIAASCRVSSVHEGQSTDGAQRRCRVTTAGRGGRDSEPRRIDAARRHHGSGGVSSEPALRTPGTYRWRRRGRAHLAADPGRVHVLGQDGLPGGVRPGQQRRVQRRPRRRRVSEAPTTPAAPAAVIADEREVPPHQPGEAGVGLDRQRHPDRGPDDESGRQGRHRQDGYGREDAGAPPRMLGYGKTYRLRAAARTRTAWWRPRSDRVTTLTPDNMTMPYLETSDGDAARQRRHVRRRDRADRPLRRGRSRTRPPPSAALQVKTTPKVAGVWYWADDQNVHWRPQELLARGHEGHGLGQRLRRERRPGPLRPVRRSGVVHRSAASRSPSPTTPRPRRSTRCEVYNAAGKVLRTMNTSMGEHSGDHGQAATTINFYTSTAPTPSSDTSNRRRCARRATACRPTRPAATRARTSTCADQDQHRRHLPARAATPRSGRRTTVKTSRTAA